MKPPPAQHVVVGAVDIAATPEVEFVQVEIARLALEAKRCRDRDRLIAISTEIDVRVDALLRLRQEQLLALIDRENSESPAPRRPRWWRRNRTAASEEQLP